MFEYIHTIIELRHTPIITPLTQRTRTIHKALTLRPINQQRRRHNILLASTRELLCGPNLLTIGVVDVEVAEFVVFRWVADTNELLGFVEVERDVVQGDYGEGLVLGLELVHGRQQVAADVVG